jgi:hypothetical protein
MAAATGTIFHSMLLTQRPVLLLLVRHACSAPVRLASKYRPGVPILVLTKSQAVADACSMIRAACTLVLAQEQGGLDRSGLVTLVGAVSHRYVSSVVTQVCGGTAGMFVQQWTCLHLASVLIGCWQKGSCKQWQSVDASRAAVALPS